MKKDPNKKYDFSAYLYLAALPVSIFCFIYLAAYVINGESMSDLKWVIAAYLISTFVIYYRHVVIDQQ